MRKLKDGSIVEKNANQYNATDAKTRNELGNCLKTARINLHMQQRNVVEQLIPYGISISAGALSKWENGDAMPNPYQFFALCYVYGIEDVLQYFTGSNGRKLNKIGLRKLQEYKQDLLATGLYEEQTRDLSEDTDLLVHPESMTGEKLIRMPVSLLKTSAGYGNFLDEDDFEEKTFLASTVPHDASFGVYITGDSMSPRYNDGQLVWIQPCEHLHPHEIGIFICDGEGFIKMYDEKMPDPSQIEEYTDSSGEIHMQPVLISLNTRYAPKVIDTNCEFRIVGRVLN